MPKKKTEDEVVETPNTEAAEETEAATEETAVEAQADTAEETAVAASAETPAEAPAEAAAETEETPMIEASADEAGDKPKKGAQKAEATDATQEPSIVDSVLEAAADTVETASEAVSTVVDTVTKGVSTVVSAVTGDSGEEGKKTSNRAERIGIVSSDKMTKTVTVRVERQVKHPIYRKYIKRRKKFMAHDELGATIGDKVRIIETRPLSAKKRWRVVEIIQKAEK